MEKGCRFKIDVEGFSAVFPFRLYIKRRIFFPPFYYWEQLGEFQTYAEASYLYDKIKNLPEYLP